MQRFYKLQRFCQQKPKFQFKQRLEQLKNQTWISRYNQNKFTYNIYSLFSVIGLLLSYKLFKICKGEPQNNESPKISQPNLNSQNENTNTGETQSEKSNQIGEDFQNEKSNTGETQSEKSNQIAYSNLITQFYNKSSCLNNSLNIQFFTLKRKKFLFNKINKYKQCNNIFDQPDQEFQKFFNEITNPNNIFILKAFLIFNVFYQAQNEIRIDNQDKLINENQINKENQVINKENQVINLDQLNEKNREIIENQVQNDCNNANINENFNKTQQYRSNSKPNQKQVDDLNPTVQSKSKVNQNMPDDSDKQQNSQISENPSNHSKEDYQNQPQQIALPKKMEVIKRILDKTTKQRVIEEKFKSYLMEQLDEKEFFNYYSIKFLEQKRQLQQHCNYVIPVRGDGNCFYTSFGYQFLRIVIYEYTDEEFNNFLDNYFQFSLQISIKNDKQGIIQVDKCLLSHYKDRIIYLRNLEKNYKNNENQSEQLKLHLQTHELKIIQDVCVDGYFNPLTVLYLRNLCLHFAEQSQNKDLVTESLLQWEVECNSNEQVIALLAENLKIHIKLIFFDKPNNFKILNYSPNYKNENRRIILLLTPGHYNIGIKK